MRTTNEPIQRINLTSFFFDVYENSDLQTINRNNPLPHKCTIKGQDFYYYNPDLSGLMWIQGEDRKLKYSDFIESYRKGFAEGLKHLKAKEGIKRKDFYNSNKIEGLKKVIRSFLYTRDFIKNYNGLQDLEKKIPLIWTEKRIYDEGYYNGLLHSILTLCNDLNIDVFEKTEKPHKEKKTELKDLKDLFKDANKYTEIMQILAEEGLIYENTGYWIDKAKGHKGFLASLVKHLYAKKYLKRSPSNAEIEMICKKTFGAVVKIDTVKRANVSISNYTFIPPNEA